MLLWLCRTTIFGRFAKGENKSQTKQTNRYAVMAQSVEHHLGKVEVPGSNPGNSSKNKYRRKAVFLLWLMSDHHLGKDVPGSVGNSSKIYDRRPVLTRRAVKSFLGLLTSNASNSSKNTTSKDAVFYNFYLFKSVRLFLISCVVSRKKLHIYVPYKISVNNKIIAFLWFF